MRIGDNIRLRIDEGIDLHDHLLLVLSKNSVDSTWVAKEVEAALAKERASESSVLLPIRIDDTEVDFGKGWVGDLRARHLGDFRNWRTEKAYRTSLSRLLRDLRK